MNARNEKTNPFLERLKNYNIKIDEIKNLYVIFEELFIDEDKDIMIITNTGMIIRLAVDNISTMSRVTQGVKLINLKENQYVSSISVIDKETVDGTEDVDSNENDIVENKNAQSNDDQIVEIPDMDNLNEEKNVAE